jgi:hypothetical protein
MTGETGHAPVHAGSQMCGDRRLIRDLKGATDGQSSVSSRYPH